LPESRGKGGEVKLLLALDSSIDAEIREAETERQAMLDGYVAASSRLAQLEAARDLRMAMGAELSPVQIGQLRREA
jgi:hypothetical protein